MKILLLIVFFSVGIFFISCEKETPIIDNDTQSVTDNIYADISTEMIFNIVNDYGISLMNQQTPKTDSGVVVTITPLYPFDLFPKTMIINYGNGIVCSDGHQRKGKIVTVFSNRWNFDSTSADVNAEITLVDFYCDNIQHVANISIQNVGMAENGPEFYLQTTNSKLIFENGQSTLWSTARTMIWVSGFQTPSEKSDDVFMITGNTTGISRESKGYSSSVIEPLRYDNTCFNGTITMGEFEVVPQELSKRKVDFGNGDCDKKATVTINGISIDVTF